MDRVSDGSNREESDLQANEAPTARGIGTPSTRRHERYLPGFEEIARRRRQSLSDALVARRVSLGLSQTEVAARMGTSQSAVARLEAGQGDVRLSSLQRYATAVEQILDWHLGEPDGG
jgi:ribosome-binding protein aMBF1 (putative translation factor)